MFACCALHNLQAPNRDSKMHGLPCTLEKSCTHLKQHTVTRLHAPWSALNKKDCTCPRLTPQLYTVKNLKINTPLWIMRWGTKEKEWHHGVPATATWVSLASWPIRGRWIALKVCQQEVGSGNICQVLSALNSTYTSNQRFGDLFEKFEPQRQCIDR